MNYFIVIVRNNFRISLISMGDACGWLAIDGFRGSVVFNICAIRRPPKAFKVQTANDVTRRRSQATLELKTRTNIIWFSFVQSTHETAS